MSTVIIGAGIAGASVALALRREDRPVAVIERAAGGGAATPASAGMIAPQYEAERESEILPFATRSRARYGAFLRSIEELTGSPVPVRWNGMLVANRSDEEHDHAVASVAWQRRAGLAAEIVGPDEASQLQPGLGPARSWIWLPDEGQVDIRTLSTRIVTALHAAGAEIHSGPGARELLVHDRRVAGVVLESGREIEAERVVLAAGAWSAHLEGLPRPLPVRPVRGQMICFDAGSGDLQRLVADHSGCYVVPQWDGSAVAGSTMEEAGYAPSVTPEGLDRVRARVHALVPRLSSCPEGEQWAGLRPVSSDEKPIIGEDPEVAGLCYATGYGRSGILLAPLLADLLAADMLGSSAWHEGLDLHPFRPDRFAPGGSPPPSSPAPRHASA